MLRSPLYVCFLCCSALLVGVACDDGASAPPEGFNDNPNVRDMMPAINTGPDALPIPQDMGAGGMAGAGGIGGMAGAGGTAGGSGAAGAAGIAGTGGEAGSASDSICGDGIQDLDEECDDGNQIDGDGCSANCTVEALPPACGDGRQDPGEDCDDGNQVDGDGCSANCMTEDPPTVCGDGIQDPGEGCDDGNQVDGDGCSANCTVEALPPACGDGQQDPGEDCDDGNQVDGDGCSANCTVEALPPACGDGQQDPGEDCDDGNQVDGDGCSANCTVEDGPAECGDGNREPGEECDDGNRVDGDGCSALCDVEEAGPLNQGQLDCIELSECLGDCDVDDQVCIDACIAASSPDGLRRADAIVTCIDENQCMMDDEVNDECADENCSDVLVGCFGAPIEPAGDADCADLIDCTEECEDLNCTRDCISAATPEAVAAAQPLDDCIFNENDCLSRDGDCAIDNCGALLTACVGAPECGNGRREEGELCDDGNRNGGDQCPADCRRAANPVCGDGQQDPGEACDDGNIQPNDGCDARCGIEPLQALDEGHLGCTDINICLNECALADEVCVEVCLEQGTPAGRERFSALLVCIAENDCTGPEEVDQACIDANCHAEEVGCFGTNVFPNGDANCAETLDCVSPCQDENCVRRCIAAADQSTFADALAVDECIFDENECPNRESDCAIENCGDVLQACRGVGECGNGWRDRGEECDDGNRVRGDGCDDQCRIENGPVCQDDVFEENDDRADSTPLLTGDYQGLQICGGDDDWYRLNICAGGQLSVTLRFIDADGDLEASLVDANDLRLAFASSSDDNENLLWDNDGGDTQVFLRVYGFLGATNEYDMRVNVAGCPADGEVRLVGGANERSGRVEIFINDQWGTVCDNFWSADDARVVCQQLGYPGAEQAVRAFGGGVGPIHLDNLQCTGNEASLLNCESAGIGGHNCDHTEDAGVVCQRAAACGDGVQDAGEECDDGNVLNGDGCSAACLLEAGACRDDAFEDNDAQADAASIEVGNVPNLQICSGDRDFYEIDVCPGGTLEVQLAFAHVDGDIDARLRNEEGLSVESAASSSDNENLTWTNPADAPATMVLEVYGFSNSENRYGMTIRLENCGGEPFNGVENGELRLADGPDENSGRLEIFIDGQWGTVCDDAFGQDDADVACRQLGFAGADRTGFFGAGDGPIQMDNVACVGNEDRLVDCQHLDRRNHNCAHIEDVGVVCSAEEPEPRCGDGSLDDGEECDDGNRNDGDGCSARCTSENLRCIDDDLEDNDAQESAAALPAGRYDDLQICAMDSDYYAVVVCPQGRLVGSIDFTDLDGDLDMDLLSDGGAELDSSTSVTDGEVVRWLNFGAEATVYIWVYGHQRAENNYSLTIELQGCGLDENPI